jgi:hypothetical protein
MVDSSKRRPVGDLEWGFLPALTLFSPSLTPVSILLTHSTYTHPRVKFNAILRLKAL